MKNGRMHPKKSRCLTSLRINALLFCGICLVAVGAVFPVFWPQYYANMIANELKMTPESKTFQVWKDNPVPIYIEFFFFNWTNRDSLEAEGEMHIPQLQELGPYRFTERIERENISWHENNTLTYKQAKYWYFDAENSKGTLDDVITTLNVVALTAAFTARDWSFITKASVASAFSLTKQEIHVKRPVRELLFEGYSDNLISMARSMPSFAGVKVPFDKFGWFYKRNGTSFMDGVFNMNTGMDNIQALGKLEFWNYRTTTDYFQGECAEVRGTTGQLFPPGQSRERSVQMFSPDLCRSISFEYGEDTVVNDVPGYKYQGGLDVLDNGTLFPSNKCYCNGECVPSGVVNVTSCRFGAPAFASFPHFYSADPFFSDNVRGMKPIKEKHQFYLVLEPTTGIPLDVAARFQINLLLQPLQGMRLYESVPTLFFPMIWFQQRATIPSDMAFSLRVLLFLRHFGIIMAIASSLSGCLLLGYSMFLCGRINRTQTMQLDDNKDDVNMYVAAMESPKLEKNSSHQYIVMKPKNEIVKTNKL